MAEKLDCAEPDVVLFAKFSIACKQGNITEAETLAERVISTSSSFQIAINTVSIFLDCCHDYNKREKMYRLLCQAFPRYFIYHDVIYVCVIKNS